MASSLATIIADFATTLILGTAVGDTTATLNSGLDADGIALPDGRYFFTIDNGLGTKEHISCMLSGTDLTDIKHVSKQGVETAGMTQKHRLGSSIEITDFAHIWEQNQMLAGIIGLDSDSPMFYNGSPIFTSDNQLITKAYAEALVAGGVGFATNTTYGTVKLSVAAVSSSIPIAVGDNDVRVPPVNTSTLTLAQIAALAGTGTPNGTTGKYVTNDDTSASSVANKVVRFDAFGNLPAQTNTFKTFLAGENITAGAPVSAGYFQSDNGIQLDNKDTVATNPAASSITKSFTIGNHTNRILIVTIHTNTTITAVSYGGVAMTLISGASNTGGNQVYYLLAPTIGTATFSVSFSGSSNASAAIHSYYNVAQTSTINTSVKIAGATSSSSPMSTSITPTVDGCLLYVSGSGQAAGGNSVNNFTVQPIENISNTVDSNIVTRAIAGDNGFCVPAQATTVALTVTFASVGTGYMGIVALTPVTVPVYGYVVNSSSEAIASYAPLTTTKYRLQFIGFAATTVLAGASLSVQVGGSVTLSGLTPFSGYYLNDTPGTIGITAGTNTRKVGTALDTTQLLITNIW